VSIEFTETQERILALLSDGLPHTRSEIHGCLPDDMGAITNIKAHLTAIRKKLPPGEMILFTIDRLNRRVYQHVRQIRRARMITDE
jgi:hypothetical protein